MEKTRADYSESIGALERAIVVLKEQAYGHKQASSLLQDPALARVTLLSQEAKKAIDALLKAPAEGLAVSAPDASGYALELSGS